MLARLINDILDFCKIEAGLLDFDINEIQTVHFLEEMDTIFNSKCAQKRRPFQIEILTPLPDTFCSDEMRIKQILLNLLCNALKHTEDGPLILKISYDEKLSLFYFEVIDTGGGILAHQQKDIFEKFKQLHKDKPGSGLGLPLSLNLARGLQGDLILKYSEAHKGSCFQASIKNQQPPVKLGVEARCHNADALMPCLKGRRLMIVDDLADNIRLLECILGPTEAFIDSTTSVQVALKKFQTSSFDLILLDLIMPEMDGFQALDLFRSAGFTGEVWAVYANAMKTQKKDCLKAGFSQHISKPIQRKGFYKKLQQWVDTK